MTHIFNAKAIINFSDGSKSIVDVKSSYSQGGVHKYLLTLNAGNSFLEFIAGKTQLFTESDISDLKYIMG